MKNASQWNRRRAEIVEMFDREVYGRRPKNIPKVTWTVASTTEGVTANVPVITKQLVGRVDNSAYPELNVTILATLSTPKNAKGPSRRPDVRWRRRGTGKVPTTTPVLCRAVA